MTTLLAALLFVQPVQFPGGKSLALAQTFSAESKMPALICDLGGKEIPAFLFDMADLNELAKTVKVQAGFVYSPGSDTIFSSGHLSRHLIRIRPINGPQNVWYEASTEGLDHSAEGVSYVTKSGHALTGVQLRAFKFSKPLTVHWMADSTPIVASIPRTAEAEFLRLVGKAMGLRFGIKNGQYELNLDATELRRRMKNTAELFANSKALAGLSKREALKVQHLDMAMRLATNEQLNTAFASPSGQVAIQLGNADKQKLYKEMPTWNDQNPAGSRGPSQSGTGGQKPEEKGEFILVETQRRARDYSAIRDSINFNQPMFIVLSATGDTYFEGMVQGRDGQPQAYRF